MRHYIWEIRPDSETITIEQNVQFHAGIYHEKNQLVKIKNGCPAAIFDFNR